MGPEGRALPLLDLVLRNLRIEDASQPSDIAIDGGIIVRIQPHMELRGRVDMDFSGRLALPGLVNPHVHLDKAFVGNLAPSGIMTEGVTQGARVKRSYTREDVKARARRAVDLAVRHGTTALRTAADVDPIVGTLCVEALLELREECADRIAIQVLAFPQEGYLGVDRMDGLMRRALELGADAVGGRPHGDSIPDPPTHIARILDLAVELGRAVDMSVDAIFPPGPVSAEQLALPILARQVVERGLQGRVTAHHALALSAVGRYEALQVAESVARAGLNVTFNPLSNLYTEGRTDDRNPRRGLTRVKELWRAGVNLSFGTDNVDDTYLPFVNLDLLTEALVASAAAHMGAREERRALVRMMTHGAAATLGIEDAYGIAVGCRADLVVLATDSIDEVVTHRPEKLAVFKRGRLVAQNTIESPPFRHGAPN